MKKILITGGAGFIGSALTNKLVSDGFDVTILDNLSKKIHTNKTNYNSVKNISNFIIGDVTSKPDWQKALIGQDTVIHLAAETGTAQSMYDIINYNKVNILGTSILLDILANQPHNIKKILVASSRSIYGEGKYMCKEHGIYYPRSRKPEDLKNHHFNFYCQQCNSELLVLPTDEQATISSSSVYALTKQYQEDIITLIGKSLGIPTVVLRYQNVFGPGQSLTNPYTGILSIFATRILNRNNLDIYEDGLESRDFIYIDDVVNATILSLKKDEANGKVFNVGSGVATTVLNVAKNLKSLFKSDVKINITKNYRIGDIRHNYADLSKINLILGFEAKYDFQKGIAFFVDWVKKQKVFEDTYEKSVIELKKKGFIR